MLEFSISALDIDSPKYTLFVFVQLLCFRLFTLLSQDIDKSFLLANYYLADVIQLKTTSILFMVIFNIIYCQFFSVFYLVLVFGDF